MPTPEPPRARPSDPDRTGEWLPGRGTAQGDDDDLVARGAGARDAPSDHLQVRGGGSNRAPWPRGPEDVGDRLRQNEPEVAELWRTATTLTRTVTTLTKTVTTLTETVTTLTETVGRLQAEAAAPLQTGDQDVLQGLRQTETELRELRESMRSLTESVSFLASSESAAGASAQALDRAQVVITHSRSYWIKVDGSLGLDERLTAVEHQLMDMRTRRDISPDGASAIVAAVAKIGAATMFGACVGAPIGAYVVGDAIVKEMVKAAIAGFVVQTAMELTERGIDHVRREPPPTRGL